MVAASVECRTELSHARSIDGRPDEGGTNLLSSSRYLGAPRGRTSLASAMPALPLAFDYTRFLEPKPAKR